MMDATNKGRPAIGPAEFAVLVKIYNAIIAQPWCVTNDDQRKLLRRYILTAYRGGMTDTEKLLEHCTAVAWEHFQAPA